MQSWAKCGFLEFSTKRTVLVTKLNDITTFRVSSGRESFLLKPGTIEPNLVPLLKVVAELQPLKNVYYFLIYGRLAVKPLPLIQ